MIILLNDIDFMLCLSGARFHFMGSHFTERIVGSIVRLQHGEHHMDVKITDLHQLPYEQILSFIRVDS